MKFICWVIGHEWKITTTPSVYILPDGPLELPGLMQCLRCREQVKINEITITNKI